MRSVWREFLKIALDNGNPNTRLNLLALKVRAKMSKEINLEVLNQ